jgi:RNA polymerase sigma-70 factor (ECF subfamily)
MPSPPPSDTGPPDPAGPQPSSTDERYLVLRQQLARVVARVCPPTLSASREDIVQAALIRILQLGEEDPTLSSSYLWKVAFSATIDELRRQGRRAESPLDDAGDLATASAHPDPERLLRGQQAGEALRACLGALAPSRRRPVTLFLLGHSLVDIAERLGMPVKRTDNLVYRGIADMRRCLRAKGYER